MSAAPAPARTEAIEELRRSLGELLGAERRLRGRDRRGPSGLTFSETRALIALGKEEDATATAGALAKAADLNPASITAILDALEERGIAHRTRAEHDRRCVVVSLTEEGWRQLREAQARWQRKLDASLGDLSDEQVGAAAAGPTPPRRAVRRDGAPRRGRAGSVARRSRTRASRAPSAPRSRPATPASGAAAAPMRNWITPMSADAVPASAPWGASASVTAFEGTKPSPPTAMKRLGMTPASPASASTDTVRSTAPARSISIPASRSLCGSTPVLEPVVDDVRRAAAPRR